MVAVNGRFLSRARPTGMQRAAARLVQALCEEEGSLGMTLLADRLAIDDAPAWVHPGIARVPLPFGSSGRLCAQLLEQLWLSRAARDAGCRVLLNPLQTCPILHRGVKQVVTVHDLHFYHHPEWFGRAFYWWNRLVTVAAIRRADHVVAISDYVLEDVRRTLKIPASRSSRVYNVGPAPRLIESAPQRALSILCVNAFQPHKNLARVLAAFETLRREMPGLELRIAGRPQENFAGGLKVRDLGDRPGVRVLGYLPDDALEREYARCSVFCFPSLSEGFGLPVLEAAACGALVVTSNTTSLPEVAGGAALLVNPLSDGELTQALRRALRMPPAEKAAWIERGRGNLARFSAAQAAEGYRRVFRTVAGDRTSRVAAEAWVAPASNH